MLAISPLRSSNDDERGGGMVGDFSVALGSGGGADNFSDEFSAGNLLDDIDFDDLFVGLDVDGDVLPDLELDPNEILAEFSVGDGGEEESGTTTASPDVGSGGDQELERERGSRYEIDKKMEEEEERNRPSPDPSQLPEEVMSKQEGSAAAVVSSSSLEGGGADKGRKPSSAQVKSSQGKRKVKVDWTPELHRRFVQAVEQLGVDKAVPSRILELMGIDCLTRHNIASHLQKYRSHRKHLLAREAEAASWSQRRQMYSGGGGGGAATGGGGKKREMTPWVAPTMGFPPPVQPFPRPLHVWGHPTVDQPMVHVWPKHLLPSRSAPPPPPWTPQPRPPLSADRSYWHQPHYLRGSVPNGFAQGAPCFPRPLAPARFPAPPVPGIPPHPMYKPDNTIPLPPNQTNVHLQFELHPSKESIDAAIGDVLTKPWLPLPLGLKPPSTDSVLVELQRQGISKIPPSCA